MKRWLLGALLGLTIVIAGTGCGVGPDKSREDAVDTTNVNKSPAHVTAFNNHYSNVADKCDGHGHRIYVTTSKVFLIIADPECPGWTKATPAGLGLPVVPGDHAG